MINFYKPSMKLADVLSYNPSLISIIERLEINLGFGDANIEQICNRYDLSLDLFLIICNIYSFKDYTPDINMLHPKDAKRIISYLKKSHLYYTNKMFPSLHENIHLMVRDYDQVNKRLINKFYDDYDSEVKKHFKYEEKIVFPYVDNLLNNNCNQKYSILKFKQKHTNIDEKLSDLKNIIIKYLPEKYSTSIKTDVLIQIFNIEEDLRKHTIVEDYLLTPLVLKIEDNERKY